MSKAATNQRKKPKSMKELTSPVQALVYRLSIVLFVILALVLLVLSRLDYQPITQLRTNVVDFTKPFLVVLSNPITSMRETKKKVSDYMTLFEENSRLVGENKRLKRLQAVAVALEAENQRLRELLKLNKRNNADFLTSRVIGDTSSNYSQSLIVDVGESSRISKGQIVTNEDGLVGRVIEVGANTSRVMLITDLNFRVPVLTEKSRERGILIGQNTPLPELSHLPPDSNIRVGERVVTSGDGKFFPPGIPVGEVYRFSKGSILIRPFVEIGRLDYINILNAY